MKAIFEASRCLKPWSFKHYHSMTLDFDFPRSGCATHDPSSEQGTIWWKPVVLRELYKKGLQIPRATCRQVYRGFPEPSTRFLSLLLGNDAVDRNG